MNSRPILFEDHSLARLRPLCWSIPQYEVRCGMFNLRERIGLLRAGQGGRLLSRPVLQGLNRDPQWGNGLAGGSGGAQGPDLWLAGRLGARWDILEGLLDLPAGVPDFLWRDGQGLLAARLSPARSRALAESWARWEGAAAAAGSWAQAAEPPIPWEIGKIFPEFQAAAGLQDQQLLVDAPGAADDGAARGVLVGSWNGWAQAQDLRLDWIWQVVPRTESALTADLEAVLRRPAQPRRPFGIDGRDGVPVWAKCEGLAPFGERLPSGRATDFGPRCDPDRLLLGEGVQWEPGLVVDTESGPVVLDHGVRVLAHARLEGPLYVGPGSLVKSGACLYGHSSFGIGNRIAGEIGESTFGDFVNKQHDGFIGHAVLGSWVNLGAMTTCSDLKNNYGSIRVDLGWGPQDTGLRFVGLMTADHVKTAIGTLFNTGTVVGFASNVFGALMPPKFVPNFSWGGQGGGPAYGVEQALVTAATVMSRRGCALGEGHAALFRGLASGM